MIDVKKLVSMCATYELVNKALGSFVADKGLEKEAELYVNAFLGKLDSETTENVFRYIVAEAQEDEPKPVPAKKTRTKKADA